MTARPGRVAMLEQFRADGVEYIFGNPGSTEENILYALGMFPQIKYILGLQETVAVAAADGYARATGKPAHVQLHVGVGLGNAIGMLYQAYRGHSPLVVFAGEAGLRYEAFDGQMATRLVDMAKPVTKYATRVVDPGSVLRVLRRAYKIAATPPMGPVFVGLPMDVLDAPNTEVAIKTHIPSTRVVPERSALQEAAAILAHATKPLILMGDGVSASGAQAELVQLAEVLGAPVWGVNSSEVNFPASHALYGGLTGHMFGKDSAQVTAGVDAVLVCGTYLFPEVFPWLDGVFERGAKIIHIDLDGYEIAKNHPVDVSFVSDPKLTLRLLLVIFETLLTDEFRASAEKRVEQLSKSQQQARETALEHDRQLRSSVPMYLSTFAEELAQRVAAEDLILFDEALTHSPELCRHLPPDLPGQFFQTRGGSLGISLPGVLGAKLARPDKTAVAVSGDGAAMYVPQALWTAAHYDIGAKFVICNNHSYRLLKLNLLQYWADQGIVEQPYPAPFELRSPDLRFDRVAASYGVESVRVERPEQIRPALDRMLADEHPFLIDLAVCDHVPGTLIGCKCGQ